MEIKSKIFNAKVMHNRIGVNRFKYKIFYLFMPLSKIKSSPISKRKFSYLSFYEKDHNPEIKKFLKAYNFDEIILVTQPRILGRNFNPVSFWLCLKNQKLIAVLSEVKNTFKETHNYFCYQDGKEIKGPSYAQKVFHVSPFFERKGEYEFNFSLRENRLNIIINYYDNGLKLSTSLFGKLNEMTKWTLFKNFLRFPFSQRTIFLIHYQALKLFIKGIKYIKKPKQLKTKISFMKDN